MCSCPLENHSCLQHVPEELANFHFLKYETHPSNLSVTHWEWPPLMRVQVEILSNMTDLGQGQHQTKTPDSMQHAGEYLVTTNIHTHKKSSIPTSTLFLDKAILRCFTLLLQYDDFLKGNRYVIHYDYPPAMSASTNLCPAPQFAFPPSS